MERFLKLVSKEKSNVMKEIEWREKNEDWLRISQRIAIKVLSAIGEQKITKEELSKKSNISLNKINTLVKGSTNLDIKTISKLESALNIKLISTIKI